MQPRESLAIDESAVGRREAKPKSTYPAGWRARARESSKLVGMRKLIIGS